jgi:hypothetical protein
MSEPTITLVGTRKAPELKVLTEALVMNAEVP